MMVVAMYKRIMNQLACDELLTTMQLGLGHTVSTLTQLAEFSRDVCRTLDTSAQVDEHSSTSLKHLAMRLVPNGC